MLRKLLLWSALPAFLVLAGAAVWMGGLNQDEGWYLYAANLVSEGQMPYRDFMFTQGPMMPIVYSAFSWVWQDFGLLGARVLTLLIGVFGLLLACALARRLAPEERGRQAACLTFLLLAVNLYHLYYLTIPKTYALSGLFVICGFYFLTFPRLAVLAGIALAFAAGTRVSLGALLVVAGGWLLFRRQWLRAALFALGALVALALAYGPFLCDADALQGLIRAQCYHLARGGADFVWMVGSVSRLVRWYPLVFVLLAFSARRALLLPIAFAVVFVMQILAPFPYEDYQVPIMALIAVFAAVNAAGRVDKTLVCLLAFATAFGSPLLEDWSVAGKDRFWSIRRECFELSRLQAVADEIERLDPGGKELFTQDLYLAVETGRKVPKGLEMGPFAQLSDAEWKNLVDTVECPVAALSGYTFAIEPPVCNERPMDRQLEYWSRLKRRYEMVRSEGCFGQNSTTLLILRKK